ncbi:tRNA 2-thiouridine(34) synthase MnmA [Immundisolibacter sp.]|uniref:tRNA 2-thiouridine(34) synthase MnmA n=1 Tax=Immundisolibacter sp. TaxID=1934948 RepID=UPI002606C14A|nr:tRNA 2-thiouridine(34) synthase MnmA [Immundisolibacter sp.]MDD3651057.1 tRNA 2-thiouridine(34) synthase MnmA [Immundisolibacter sp.]
MDAPYGLPVPPPARVVVGLSGGVDSAVTALLLQRAGYEVIGLFMKNWEDDDTFGDCPAAADIADVQAIAARLDIPVQVVNFAAEYREQVFAHFLAEYRRGRTPNPDVLCNRQIKFGVFREHALRLGAQAIATGHYAALRRTGGVVELLCPADEDKDQTYFLHALTQTQLAPAGFALADLTKRQVRALAAQAGLMVAHKKDSTGICFIGERPFREFLSRYLVAEPGDIVDAQGRVIGRHVGLPHYTLGQRQGLGIGGGHGASGAAWYVAGKDTARNALIVVQGHDHPLLLSSGLESEPATWIAGTAPARRFACTAKTRYRQRAEACEVTVTDDGRCQVRFSRPQRAVTPGQSVVFYRDGLCLGGAVIDTTAPLTEATSRQLTSA